MFTDITDYVLATIAEHDRAVSRLLAENEARAASTTDGNRRRVRFPIPEWLRQAAFVLRPSAR